MNEVAELSTTERAALKAIAEERQAAERLKLDDQRRAWCAELRELEAGVVEGWPELEAAVHGAEHAVQEARKAMQEAQQSAATARLRLHAAKHRYSVQRDSLRTRLITTAPEQLDEEIRYWRGEEGALMKRTPQRHLSAGRLNVLSLKKKNSVRTNSPALRSRLEYCRWCVAQLESWKVSAPTLEQQAIENLRTSAPNADALSEFEIEHIEKDGVE